MTLNKHITPGIPHSYGLPKSEHHITIEASQYLGIKTGMIFHQPLKIAPPFPLLRKFYIDKRDFKYFNFIYVHK